MDPLHEPIAFCDQHLAEPEEEEEASSSEHENGSMEDSADIEHDSGDDDVLPMERQTALVGQSLLRGLQEGTTNMGGFCMAQASQRSGKRPFCAADYLEEDNIDLASYFQRFSVDIQGQIAICRSYANMLAAVEKVKKTKIK